MSHNKIIGDFGEEMARNFLTKRGYKIITSNVKISYLELDIIAKFKKKYIFVEVKTRTSFVFGGAEDAMDQRKINNFKRGVSSYISRNKIDPKYIRLDLISIDIDRDKKLANIKHYKDII